MRIIYPRYIDWSEAPILSFRGVSSMYNFRNHDYSNQVGKIRRTLAIKIREEYIEEILNLIMGNEGYQFLVILPFFPMSYYNPDDTNLLGEVNLLIDGNIYNRPMTVISNLRYASGSFGVKGTEELLLMNKITEDLQINRFQSIQPIVGSWGSDFPYLQVTLQGAINIPVTQIQLVVYNFFYGRIVDDNSQECYNNHTGDLAVAFEEIFEDEVPA